MPITTDLDTAVGQVRLELGDTVEGDGVRPQHRNFSDGEITYFLTAEGDHVGRATARGCEVLAREWAAQPTAVRVGPQGQQVKASEFYRLLSEQLRRIYGRNQATTPIPMGTMGVRLYPAGANPADE